MKRITVLSSIATLALVSAAPVAAQLGGVLGGGGGANVGGAVGGVGSTVGGAVGAQGGNGASVSDQARVNSQGAANASVNGLANTNANSALSGAGVTTLTGIETGLSVKNSTGASIGTVSKVITNNRGAVVGVKVKLAGGGSATIPATTLAMNGSVVTTTWVHRH